MVQEATVEEQGFVSQHNEEHEERKEYVVANKHEVSNFGIFAWNHAQNDV